MASMPASQSQMPAATITPRTAPSRRESCSYLVVTTRPFRVGDTARTRWQGWWSARGRARVLQVATFFIYWSADDHDGFLAHVARRRPAYVDRLLGAARRVAADRDAPARANVHVRSGAAAHHRERGTERDGRPRHEPGRRVGGRGRADHLASRDRMVAAAEPGGREADRGRGYHAGAQGQGARRAFAPGRHHAG